MEDHDLERGRPRTRRPLRQDELFPAQPQQPPDEPKSSSTTQSQTPSEDEKSQHTSPDPVFEPIQSPQSNNHRPSLNTIRTARNTTSIHRTPSSNNGYGCDTPLDEADVPPDGKNPPDGSAPQESSESEKDPFIVTWDGDDDPDNPRNMSTTRKWVITGIACFGAFAVTNASAVYTSTYASMAHSFPTTRLISTIGLSSFVLGIALGPFWSPLAEFYGRRPIYLVSFLSFLIFLIPSAVAQNIETIIVTRFLQGLAGSAFLSVSGGTVGDLFSRDDMQAPMALFTLAPFIGPSTGPLIGGLENTFLPSWRWTHYIVLMEAGVILAALWFFVPETYHPVLLAQKAARLRKSTGDPRHLAPMETGPPRSVRQTISVSLLRPLQMLYHEPMCLILDLYSAVLLGLLYLFFGAFPLIFTTNHGFNLWQVGLTFLGILVSMPLAALTTPFWHRLRRRLAERRGGQEEPEDQLPMVVLGAPLITGGLFWFGFTTYPNIHWIVPIMGSLVFGMGTMLAFTGIFTFLVDAYPRYAASALAGNALVRCSFAAAFPLFGIQLYEGLGFQWATGLLAFVTLAMLPFPYLFFRYGKRLRSRSRFAKVT